MGPYVFFFFWLNIQVPVWKNWDLKIPLIKSNRSIELIIVLYLLIYTDFGHVL